MRDEYIRTIDPARALAAGTLTWSAHRMRSAEWSGLAYVLTPAEITLMWQTAPPRMTIAPDAG